MSSSEEDVILGIRVVQKLPSLCQEDVLSACVNSGPLHAAPDQPTRPALLLAAPGAATDLLLAILIRISHAARRPVSTSQHTPIAAARTEVIGRA